MAVPFWCGHNSFYYRFFSKNMGVIKNNVVFL